MAKQVEDHRTAELPLPDVPRKRGRPRSVNHPAPAVERKRQQRIRDIHAKLSARTLEGLLSGLGKAVREGRSDLIDDYADELRHRARLVMANF